MAKKKDGYIKVKAEYELVYAQKEPKASILTNTLEAPLQEVRVFEYSGQTGFFVTFGEYINFIKLIFYFNHTHFNEDSC